MYEFIMTHCDYHSHCDYGSLKKDFPTLFDEKGMFTEGFLDNSEYPIYGKAVHDRHESTKILCASIGDCERVNICSSCLYNIAEELEEKW